MPILTTQRLTNQSRLGAGQRNTSNFGDVAVVIGGGIATAQGGENIAWAIGNKADAIAAGKYNLAFAQGNTGPNPGMVVTTSEDAFAEAVGFGNRAVAVGDVGKGSDSYAGSLPPKAPPGNAPKNQFAAAIGDHRNALNGINNK
jgi:hypothetical protein